MTDRMPSIRQRLSRTLVVVSLIWGLAVAAVVTAIVRHEVDEVMDATLRQASQILYTLLHSHGPQLPRQIDDAAPASRQKEELVWQVVDGANGVVLRSHQAPAEPLAGIDLRGIVSIGSDWRVLVSTFDAGGRVLMVAQTGKERHEAKLEATEYTVGGALMVGLLCAAWLRSRVRRELEPLSALSPAVGQYNPLRPGAELADAQRQELQPLREAIMTLGSRLAARVNHERAFAGHAAHALRTPLAGMMAQLAAAQQVSPPQAQPMLKLARQAADRLRRVVSAILTLFRTGSEVRWQPVQLAKLVQQLQIDHLAFEVEPADTLVADPNLLAAALSNLLDNAIVHGAHTVRLRVHEAGTQGTCIVLTDDGPGMSEAQRQNLSDALRDQHYQGRMGMGLMLADLVARAHGGHVHLPPCTDGFRVQLWIGPARPTAASGTSALPSAPMPL